MSLSVLGDFYCCVEIAFKGRNYRLQSVCEGVLETYVCHVCLLRPLEEAGKMKVTTDMAQIELALAPFCQRLSGLGLPYRKLRALRYVVCTV